MAKDGRGGRTILIIVAVIALLAVAAYALKLYKVDVSGNLQAPEVSVDVKGGEVPDVDIETGNVDLGTEEETIKLPDIDVKTRETTVTVPDVDVKPAEDDGSTKQ